MMTVAPHRLLLPILGLTLLSSPGVLRAQDVPRQPDPFESTSDDVTEDRPGSVHPGTYALLSAGSLMLVAAGVSGIRWNRLNNRWGTARRRAELYALSSGDEAFLMGDEVAETMAFQFAGGYAYDMCPEVRRTATPDNLATRRLCTKSDRVERRLRGFMLAGLATTGVAVGLWIHQLRRAAAPSPEQASVTLHPAVGRKGGALNLHLRF